MSFKLDPVLFLKDLDKIQSLSKNIIDTELTIVSLGTESYSLDQYYASGSARVGKPSDSSFIIPTRQLTQIISSMRGDKTVTLNPGKDCMEFLSDNRSYQVPVKVLTDEMKTDMFKSNDKGGSKLSIPEEMVIPISSVVTAQQRMNSKSSIKAIVDIKKDDSTTVMVGGTSVVGIVEFKGTPKEDIAIESNDNILMQMLLKLGNTTPKAELTVREHTISLKDTGVEMIHTITTKQAKSSSNRITAITGAKEPSTTVTMNATELLDRIRNTELITDRMERILINFTKDNVEIKVSSGLVKYKSAFKTTDMTLSGEELSLMFPVIIIQPIISSLVEMTDQGKITIKIYPAGDSKVIRMECAAKNGVSATYLLRVSTGGQ
jgi:hypothetical protein